jgi:hypothetical protein
VLGMEFTRGLAVPSALTPGSQQLRAYSGLDGLTRETPYEVSFQRVRYRPGGARIRLGDHPYAKELASLGFPKRALVSSSADNVAMSFGDAREV